MSEDSVVYVLCWYPDGSGKPLLHFFRAIDAISAVRLAAEKSRDGMNIECGEATVMISPPAGAKR